MLLTYCDPMSTLETKSLTTFGHEAKSADSPGLTRSGFSFFGSCGVVNKLTTTPTTTQDVKAMGLYQM